MISTRIPRRLAALSGLLALASLLSCGREVTGPENGIHGRTATLAFVPHFPARAAHSVAAGGTMAHSFSDLVPFNRVRVVLRRGQEIAADRMVNFPPNADSVALTVSVVLSSAATSEGETFSATLEYLNAANQIVFLGGPVNVVARANAGNAQAVEIALEHVGPGSGGKFLEFFPDSLVGAMGDTLVFTSEAYDQQEAFLENAVILHVSRDTLVARVVHPGEPRVRLVGARGRAWIIAELFDGDIDSVQAIITPTPTALVIAGGNNQQTLQGTPFPAPLRVQVRAADNLGVEGWPVTFTVTTGDGSLDSSSVVTDASGFAEMGWTAGSEAGPASVTASIEGPTLSVVFNGTQISGAPTSPAAISVVGGAGQSAPALTELADSIVFLVVDQFEQPVAGVSVDIVGVLGGGSVSPTSAITDANGLAATSWTLGESGPQQLTALVTDLPPVNVTATVIGGGPAVLFAGYDYTYVPTGGSRTIPIFLSAPSETETVVYLTSEDSEVVAWAVDSVVIAPGITQVGVAVNGLANGEVNVYLESALGNDTVFILVAQPAVGFQELEYSTIQAGDTARILVRLSHPAPVGGAVVTVTLLDSTYFLVAPGNGYGTPAPGCLGGYYCSGTGGLRADETPDADVRGVGATALLLAPPAGTALLNIPEGALTAQVAVIALHHDGEGSEVAQLVAEAPNYQGSGTTIYSVARDFDIIGSSTWLTELVGEGQIVEAYVQRGTRGQTSDVIVTMTSDNPAVFTVDSAVRILRNEYHSPSFRLFAHQAGEAHLIAESPGFPTDTVLITVAAPAIRIYSAEGGYLDEGASGSLRFYAGTVDGYTGFRRQADLPVTISIVSGDSAIALNTTSSILRAHEEDRTIGVRAIGPGEAMILIEAPGHAPDSVLLSTVPTNLGLLNGSPVGIGQFATVIITVPPAVRETESRVVTVSSSNPGIARVLTPAIVATAANYWAEVQIEGVNPGTVQITATTPGIAPLSFDFDVTTSDLLLAGGNGTWYADSVVRAVNAFTVAGGATRAVVDTLVAILHSSDPSVAEVVDSIIVIKPGESYSPAGTWRAVAPGTAELTLHAPGYATSAPNTVVVDPPELLVGTPYSNVGRGLTSPVSVARTSPTGAPLAVAITQLGPGSVDVVAEDLIVPTGVAVHAIFVSGVTLGTDTLIFTASGHKPDTVVINVVPPQLYLDVTSEQVAVDWVDNEVGALLSHSSTYFTFAPPAEKKFVLTSLTPDKATVLQDTIVFQAHQGWPWQFGAVQYHAVGIANLVLSDPEGVFPDASLQILIEPRTVLGPDEFVGGAMTIGMGQQTFPYEFYVSTGVPLPTSKVIYLTSSDTSVIAVPDSVIVPAFLGIANVTITARDTVGSARISASAPGWNEYELDVVVTRSEILTFATDPFVGAEASAEVYVVDAVSRTTRPRATPITMRFRTDRPDIADAGAATFTYPAEAYWLDTQGPTGVSVGRTLVYVEDTLATSDSRKMLSQASELSVHRPTLYATADRKVIGRGLASATSLAAYGLKDSVWVTFTSVGGRFGVIEDSVQVVRYEYDTYGEAAFTLRGDTFGTDTLVLSAAGFTPDTVLIVVEPGVLELQPGTAPRIVVGDSTLVVLDLRDAAGFPAVATDVLTLSFSIDTTFAVTDGTTTIGSLVIQPDATTVSFWVKALQQGSSTLVVTSSSSFRTFRYVFSTRPILP